MQPPGPESTSGQVAIPQLPASNLAHLWPVSVVRPDAWLKDRGAGVAVFAEPVSFNENEIPLFEAAEPGAPPVRRADAELVALRAMAAMGAALVALRDYGLVQFAIERKKTLFIKSVEVTLTITGQAVLDGIEADLLTAAALERTVWGTVRRWFGSDFEVPALHVNRAAIKWGIRYGVIHDVVEKRDMAHGKGQFERHTYPTVPEVLTACRAQADALAQRWRRFLQDEPELAKELMGKVEGAIGSRVVAHAVDV